MNETFRGMLAGNGRHAATVDDQFDQLQHAQHPRAVTISCGDSRVLQDEMWHNHSPGAVFTHSNIGNRVRQETATGSVVSGDVLYPLVHTGTKTAIVVGHTGCGAITATYDALRDGPSDLPGIEYCVDSLADDIEPGHERVPADIDRATAVNYLVEYNVDRQVETLVNSSDVPDGIAVAGVVYDFQDTYGGMRGEAHVINVAGLRDPDQLRASYPAIADRIDRLWAY
jgi:carbonic anhydrase